MRGRGRPQLAGRLREGDIKTALSKAQAFQQKLALQERGQVVGDRYARLAASGVFSCVLADRDVAMAFDRSGQRQSGRVLDERHEPGTHASGCTGNDDFNHLDLESSLEALRLQRRAGEN